VVGRRSRHVCRTIPGIEWSIIGLRLVGLRRALRRKGHRLCRRCGSQEFQSTYCSCQRSSLAKTRISRNSHHDLPGVNGQVSIVERPVELLLGNGLIGRVVVRCEVGVGERGAGLYAGARVEDQHLLKELNGLRVCVLELVLEGLALTLGQRLDESEGVLAADRADNIIWRGAEQFGDDGELVDVVLSGEKGLALEHFSEDAACAPDVYLDVVLLPREHDLRCSVVSRRDIAGHLRVLDTGKAKVANLQIAVLVDENVGGFEVTVDNAGGVDVFQTTL
jgi:hypothetical protein